MKINYLYFLIILGVFFVKGSAYIICYGCDDTNPVSNGGNCRGTTQNDWLKMMCPFSCGKIAEPDGMVTRGCTDRTLPDECIDVQHAHKCSCSTSLCNV